MSKGKRPNPTWANVTAARAKGMREMLEVVCYVLESKNGFEQEDITNLMDNVSYTLEAVSEGRLNITDIRDAVRNDVKVVFRDYTS